MSTVDDRDECFGPLDLEVVGRQADGRAASRPVVTALRTVRSMWRCEGVAELVRLGLDLPLVADPYERCTCPAEAVLREPREELRQRFLADPAEALGVSS